jgi:cytochrome c553
MLVPAMPATALLLTILAAEPFTDRVRPVLAEHCTACHNPASAKNRVGFLRAQQAADLERDRGTWRKVAAHLRNRTMPPTASKLSEEDRLFVARWVDDRLRATACALGEQAGTVTLRRLNRREYKNTLRDLFGLEYAAEDLFPADEAGGEGFDNNGETLFVPPMLMERYLEAAQQVLDRVVVTPALSRNFNLRELAPQRRLEKDKPLVLEPGETVRAALQVYNDGDYAVAVWARRPKDREKPVWLQVDDRAPVQLMFNKDPQNGPTARAQTVKLARGAHKISVRNGDFPLELLNVKVDQRLSDPTPDRRVVHHRLFRLEPGDQPSDPRAAARHLLTRLLPRAFRRPVTAAEIERYLKLYDRSAQRGEPFEESIKLALKAVLVAPDFLFLIESEPSDGQGLHALSDHELAARLSYFLWSTMPDEELTALANAGKLREPATLAAQTNRLLDDPRSRVFAQHFIGQWLNTKEIGGRIAPTISSVSHFYTPEVAVDLREEPVLFFHHLLSENKSVLDMLTANYTFMNERLVRFYEYEDKLQVSGTRFQKVTWPDGRRAGLLGMGAVLAVSSQIEQTNPVLRGAWLLDTLLGTPAPAPPPDVPALPKSPKGVKALTMRQRLQQHQADATCASCHRLIDPMGYALENFDWLGRWRDTDNGQAIDAAGVMPTGESFNGPVELRQALLAKKEDFLRRVIGKVMGYGLGRSLEDADHCTIQRILEKLERENYGTRTLVTEVVLSTPFRYRSPGARKEVDESKPVKKQKLDFK